MRIIFGSRTVSASASVLALLFASPKGIAQEVSTDAVQTGAPAAAGGLEEIVVTAQKRSESMQRVGISVTAFSADKLQQLGFTNATDLVRQTPGLSVLTSSASNTNVNIRGVSQNDFADHLEGPIAVYSDEGYLGASGALNGQIFDLERVEVLRGPQGTLFGRNATGGLIHYISRAPAREFGGYTQVTFGERGLREFEGAVGGPLRESVQGRLSIAGTQYDGNVTNDIGKNPANRNNYSGRGQLAFDLSDKVKLRLLVNGTANAHERGPAISALPAVANANGLGRFLTPGEAPYGVPNANLLGYVYPASPYRRDIDSPGQFKKNLFHAQAKLTAELGGVVLTSISDYLNLYKALLDYDVDGSPAPLFNYSTRQRYNQYSQELRLNGENDKFKWIAGLYGLAIRGNYGSSVMFGAQLLGVAPVPIQTRDEYSVDVNSVAAFDQVEYALSDTLTAIAGLRYTYDEKVADYAWSFNLAPIVTRFDTSTDPAARQTYQNVSAKAALNWQLTMGTLLYASYSRGNKAGNFAFPVFPPPILPSAFVNFPHRQEVLTDYETGVKTELLGNHLRFNASTFYYNYENYQAFSLSNLLQTIVNKDAKAYGGELEMVIVPTRGWELSAAAAFMDSKVYDMSYPSGGTYTAQLPFAAHASFNGLARYEWSALGGMLAVQGSFKSMGGHYFTVANEPLAFQKRYLNADARVSYVSANNRWNAALFVRNLTNARYMTYSLDLSAIGLAGAVFGDRRLVGGTIGVNF